MPFSPKVSDTPAFSLANVGFAFKLLSHLIRTSGGNFSLSTVKRFITARNGNKERLFSILGIVASDPYFLQHKVQSIEKDYEVLKLGENTAYFIRDFDLWMKCSTELGHRGEFVPELFNKCFPGAAINSQPSRYGEWPYGNWDLYKDQEPHFMSRDRFPEQADMIRRIVHDHFESYIGKTVEIGKLMRLLVWNVYTATTFGVPPSEETERMLSIYDAHLPEFDYAVRMTGAKIPYEWSPKLKEQVQQMEDWGKGIFKERLGSISKCSHMSDVLTDTIANHSDVDLKKSEGAIRGVYAGGMNNFQSAICGALIFNAKNDDAVYNYYMADEQNNMEHIIRESLRLYTSIPTFRNIREEDNLTIDGEKLEPGTDVLLSTYAINTDPRSWDNALEFDASRFEGTNEIGFLCQKGFAPLGASANVGGRPCGARYHIANMMKIMLDTILKEYKMTANRGGYYEMKQLGGQCMYAGKCKVKVERR